MKKTMLETVDLVKYFDTKNGIVHAVDHVNLSIPEGETLGVVGESGCGKSTLGRCILNLIPATSGQILFDDKNILERGGKSKDFRQKMQIVCCRCSRAIIEFRISCGCLCMTCIHICGDACKFDMNFGVQTIAGASGIQTV